LEFKKAIIFIVVDNKYQGRPLCFSWT